MDGLRETALAYYSAFGESGKNHANKVFNKMKPKGVDNKYVELQKFSKYMENNHKWEKQTSKRIFEELRGEKDGLDLEHVVIALFLAYSKRPLFCGGCDQFIKGTYFTCVKCLNDEGKYSFNVCPECFGDENYIHDHQIFMDPVLLILEQQQKLKEAQAKNQQESKGAKSKKRLFSELVSAPRTPTPKRKKGGAINTDNSLSTELAHTSAGFGDRVLPWIQAIVSVAGLALTAASCTIM